MSNDKEMLNFLKSQRILDKAKDLFYDWKISRHSLIRAYRCFGFDKDVSDSLSWTAFWNRELMKVMRGKKK